MAYDSVVKVRNSGGKYHHRRVSIHLYVHGLPKWIAPMKHVHVRVMDDGSVVISPTSVTAETPPKEVQQIKGSLRGDSWGPYGLNR